jgi:hypothetical protein
VRATDERLNNLEQACRAADRVWFGFDPMYRRRVEDALGLRRSALRDEAVSIYALGEHYIAACGSVRVSVPVHEGSVSTYGRMEVPNGYASLTDPAVGELTDACASLIVRRLGLHRDVPASVQGMIPCAAGWLAISESADGARRSYPVVGWLPDPEHGCFWPVVISGAHAESILAIRGEHFVECVREIRS